MHSVQSYHPTFNNQDLLRLIAMHRVQFHEPTFNNQEMLMHLPAACNLIENLSLQHSQLPSAKQNRCSCNCCMSSKQRSLIIYTFTAANQTAPKYKGEEPNCTIERLATKQNLLTILGLEDPCCNLPFLHPTRHQRLCDFFV